MDHWKLTLETMVRRGKKQARLRRWSLKTGKIFFSERPTFLEGLDE